MRTNRGPIGGARPFLYAAVAVLAGGLALLPAACRAPAGTPPTVRVGSKNFPESMVLGEMVALLAGRAGAAVEHREGLGGTRILWDALLAGHIDVYPDYTGTLTSEILAGSGVRGEEDLRRALAERGLRMSRSLGFQNNYALGMKKEVAGRLGVRRISDLARHPGLRIGFSNEFMKRADGWPGLQGVYRLPQQDVRGIEHALTYPSLRAEKIDVTDLYLTDADLQAGDIAVLEDDRGFFPAYDAVLVYREDLAGRAPEAVAAFLGLEGRISEEEMRAMNVRAKVDQVPAGQVAADFLSRRLGIPVEARVETVTGRLLRRTREHLFLVGTSLTAAVLIAVPLGILAARRQRVGQVILAVTGVVQTIPSLALLVFMIPLLGIGGLPAIVALFLYSLLPIVRNTHAGLHDIPASVRESAEALGLPARARLWLVELPMASRSILAGIKTAAVINVGTATLGALVGAGGYGQPILTGIPLNNTSLILQGAVPAALLALLVQGLFELAERVLVPRGLRLQARG